MKKNIYLAAPRFSPKQIVIYNQVAENLRAIPGYELMPPHDSVMEDGCATNTFTYISHMFTHEIELLNKADIVYGIDWSLESDANTAWKLGYAYAQGIPVVIVRPQEVKLSSLMVAGGNIAVVDEKLDYRTIDSADYK